MADPSTVCERTLGGVRGTRKPPLRGLRTLLVVFGLLLTTTTCSRTPTGPNENPWRLLPGHVEAFSFASFRDGRQCWVYLPPGYERTTRRYPVLYLHDGEMAFDGPGRMHVNRICEELIRRGEMEPIIVVSIETGSIHDRIFDYTPWQATYRAYATGGGDLYLRAIRDTLKPEIDRRYHTLTDARNTAIAGMSLGGLISAYAGYADSTFGKVAAFSPSYWWAGEAMYRFAEARGRRPWLSLYYKDTGYPFDNSIGSMERLLLAQGFVSGRTLLSVVVEGAEHQENAWERRFPGALKFLFPPAGDP